MRRNMSASENIIRENSLKANQSIFLFCDQCLWTVTCLNKKYLEELSEISEAEIPAARYAIKTSCLVIQYHTMTHLDISHSKSKGLVLIFGKKHFI